MRAPAGDAASRVLRGAGGVLVAAAFLAPRSLFSALAAIGLTLVLLAFLPRGTRRIVFAAMVGMATGQGAILLFTTGIFQAPITAEFGWSRTEYFMVTPISVVGAILTAPLVGGALDRFGVRRVVLPSVLLLVAVLVGYSRLTSHLWHLYLVAFLFAVLGAGTNSAAYARLITYWFERQRGLALGAALAGVGIGGATLSPLVQWLVGAVGWRGGFLALALFVLLTAFPLLFLWLRDSPTEYGLGMDGVIAAPEAPGIAPLPPGVSVRAGVRSAVFRRMTLAFGLLGFAMGGMLFQMFPILVSLRVPSSTAATVLGSMGIAIIGGRSFCGYLMDRFFAPRVAVAFLMGPLLGCAVLATGVGGLPALIAALAVGLAAGAEVDVLAYLTARYFGRRTYATLFNWIYVAWSTGSGLGPLLGARISDTTGSYSAALWAYAGIFGVASVLLLSLGPFPDWGTPATGDDRDAGPRASDLVSSPSSGV